MSWRIPAQPALAIGVSGSRAWSGTLQGPELGDAVVALGASENPDREHTAPALARRAVLAQAHFLVLETAPQPVGEDVVQSPAPPVHAGLDASLIDERHVVVGREVAALVAIEDPGTDSAQVPPHGRQHQGSQKSGRRTRWPYPNR